MKLHHPALLSVALLSLVLTFPASPLQAADVVRYEGQPSGSKVRIDGTSTIHDWTVESHLIGGAMELDANFPQNLAEAIKVTPKVNSVILVRSLKSGKTAMDDIMHTSMKQKEHPKIEYKLLELSLKEPPASPGAAMKFNSKGTLTVAGVTRTNAMVVTMQPMAGDKLKVTGSTDLKMTEFGIKPPTQLGVFKTGDEVKISFEWMTAKKK